MPSMFDTITPELTPDDAEHAASALTDGCRSDCSICAYVANVLRGDAAIARKLANTRPQLERTYMGFTR